MKTRTRRGSALLEAALALLLVGGVFGGVFEIGYGIYEYHTLLNAVQEGARYASIRAYDSADSTPSSAFLKAVQNVVVYGNPSGGQTAVVPGLAPSDVELIVATEDNGPARMTVGIRSFALNTMFKPMRLTGKPAVTFPYIGPKSAPPTAQ